VGQHEKDTHKHDPSSCEKCIDLGSMVLQELKHKAIWESEMDKWLITHHSVFAENIGKTAYAQYGLSLGIETAEKILSDAKIDFLKICCRQNVTFTLRNFERCIGLRLYRLVEIHMGELYLLKAIDGYQLLRAPRLVNLFDINEEDQFPKVAANCLDRLTDILARGVQLYSDTQSLRSSAAIMTEKLVKLFEDSKTKDIGSDSLKVPADVQQFLNGLIDPNGVLDLPVMPAITSGKTPDSVFDLSVNLSLLVLEKVNKTLNTTLKQRLIEMRLIQGLTYEQIALRLPKDPQFATSGNFIRSARSVRAQVNKLMRELIPVSEQMLKSNPKLCPSGLLLHAVAWSAKKRTQKKQ
jgi:hypothetical protein